VSYRRKKFTFAISSPDEYLLRYASGYTYVHVHTDIQTRSS